MSDTQQSLPEDHEGSKLRGLEPLTHDETYQHAQIAV
jgi:hypothetical protein